MKQTTKKILFLCQYFYPEYISSATLPYDTAQALADAGFNVSAMCGYPKEYNINNKNGVPLKETYKGMSIKRLRYIHSKRSSFIGRIINYFSFTVAVALNLVRLKEYDIVIVYSNPPVLPFIAALSTKLWKNKLVFVSYDVYPEIAYINNILSKDAFISKLMRFINKFVFKNTSKVVALSNDMKQLLIDKRSQLNAQKIVVIPNWYDDIKNMDIDKAFENKLFKKLLSKNHFVVSYLGNMGTAQDLDTIIDTIRILKDNDRIRFLFAGHGNKVTKLKNRIEAENLGNVTVLDFLHGKDYIDALSVSDCFFVSLDKEANGLAVPSKTYGYMMAGKPIIAVMSKESDIAKDIQGNAGYVAENGESVEIANFINALIEDEVMRDKMGRNCRNIYLQKYTRDICTQKYLEMIRDLLEV